jgi:hypothetical protein
MVNFESFKIHANVDDISTTKSTHLLYRRTRRANDDLTQASFAILLLRYNKLRSTSFTNFRHNQPPVNMADTETKIKPEEEVMEGESENNDEVCQVYECAVGRQWCAGSCGVGAGC